MRLSTWNRRIAMTGCCAALGLAVIAPAASAQSAPTPAPVAPITLSPQESQQVCSDMLPKLEQRVNRLTTQINGGPEVKGSVQWLKAKAQDQRNKKHDKAADRLDQRAQRRAERINDLNQAKQRLDAFRSQHCQPAGGAQ
jgi:hypothetical protein